MLILVAVTITMAVNGGLFGKAADAGRQTNEAVALEQELGSGKVKIKDGTTIYEYDNINAYFTNTPSKVYEEGEIPEEPETPGDDDGGVPNPKEKFSKIYTANETIEEGDYKAVIPEGFAVGTSNGINTIAGGLVITDKVNSKGQSIGNEFVWIPVTYTPAGDADPATKKLDSGFLNKFKRNTTDSYYLEPYTSGYTTPKTEADDYYDMMLSVQNNGGFYVGRYEAGIEPTYIDENGEPKTHTARTAKANDTTLPVVVKRDCYPYNYVGWGESMSNYTNPVTDWDGYNQGYGAVYLSKHLLDNQSGYNETGATSTLMYGVQWDAMLRFMGKENDTNSTEWGNYKNNDIVIDRPTARYTNAPYSDTTWTQISTLVDKEYPKTNTEGILLTTGAHDDFEEKNIYDVAGNVWEWTMEAYSSYRVGRGDYFYYSGGSYPAPFRDYDNPNDCPSFIGFRPTLYITNE